MTNNPDPHGQAGLMFCEGLAHLLIEAGVVSKEQVIDVIEGIIDVKREIAGAQEPVAISTASILLLQTISRSVSAASAPRNSVATQEKLEIETVL